MRDVVIYGLAAGVLIATLRFIDYRFVIVEHSVEIYGALVAVIFAAVGIRLGLSLKQRGPVPTEIKEVTIEVPVPTPAGPFVRNQARIDQLQITPRELEVLGLMAEGLSNKEMAHRLCVSENTVKTHCSRVFDKLGAERRTQAVQIGKRLGLIA